jgi:anti-sigma-K factor RskA
MIPHDPDDMIVLAGEYVLGLLDEADRLEVEDALASHADLRDEVAFWHARLFPLTRSIPLATPDVDTWPKIAARLKSSAGDAPSGRAAAFWRRVAVGFAAVAACLAIYVGAGLMTPAPGPQLVAALNAPQARQSGWIATADRDGLILRNIGGGAPPAGRVFELWSIAAGTKTPVPLGVIPAAGSLKLATAGIALADATLAVSIEPPGGSPTGAPTGPVVYVGIMKPI